jgi:hypothetical protein
VLAPGGVLGARDSDYAGFFWAPSDPLLDRWLVLYHQLTARSLSHHARYDHLNPTGS